MAEIEFKLFVYILVSAIVISILFHIFTYQKDEGFSELYFNGNLPNYIDTNKTYDFSFTVANHEESAETFSYEAKVELYNLYDVTEGIYKCSAKNRKKVEMKWLGNETLYTESDDYGRIEWPHYSIQYSYTNLMEGGTFTTVFHNESPLYYFTIHEDSSEIEFNGIRRKANLSASNNILINTTNGLKYYINDQLIFNESIDMPTNGWVDFNSTIIPSVTNLVVYQDSPIQVVSGKYIRDYSIDSSVIMKKLEESNQKISILRHEINISDNPDYYNDSELSILAGLNVSGIFESRAYIQNTTVEALPWANYTLRMDFQPYTQSHNLLVVIDDIKILFSNSDVYLYSGSNISKAKSPVVMGANQLLLNSNDDNIEISVNNQPLFTIKKQIRFENISLYTKKTLMAIGNILVTEKGCNKQSCRRVYSVESERSITQRRDLKATSNPEEISAGLGVNPLLGIAAILSGYTPQNESAPSLDYDIELNPSVINENIPSEDYVFDGPNAAVNNKGNYSFSYTFSMLEGAGLLETSFHDTSGKKVATLILNQPENSSFLYTNTDQISRSTATLDMDIASRHRIDFVYESGKLDIYINGKKIHGNIQADLSNGFFSISTLNTHFLISDITFFDRSTRERVPFSTNEDPCRLRKIEDISLGKEYLYLNNGENASIAKNFTIKNNFDFGKVSVNMTDKEIHFWVIRND